MMNPALIKAKPAAGILELVVTSGISFNLIDFVACNEGVSDDYIRFLINPISATSDSLYLLYDVKVKGNSTYSLSINDVVPKGSTLKVYSRNGNVTFSIFIQEIS